MANKSYSSIYDLKKFMIESVAPLYVDTDEINMLNIGLFGIATDFQTSAVNDISQMIALSQSELTPNTARQASTIYANAALYKMDDVFATPAALNIIFLLKEDELFKACTLNNGIYSLTLDSNTTIDINGIPFMFMNDIVIQIKKFRGENVYNVRYDDTFSNDLLDITNNPYLQTKMFNLEDGRYLGILIKPRQVYKSIQEENLIDNQYINFPKLTVNYNNMLANFEVFYKGESDSDFIQLKKIMKDSAPLSVPFCYYSLTDEGEFEITFSSKDRYFTPEFNSVVKIEYYTTLGSKGNFDKYNGNGSDITINLSTEKYRNNGILVVDAYPHSGSVGGADAKTFDQLKEEVCAKFASVNTINTETDLQTYFANSHDLENVEILFSKKRDDVFLRLFSAYSYFRDRNDDIIHAHTLDFNINPSDMERVIDDANCDIIKPGSIFRYVDENPSSKNYDVMKIDDVKMNNLNSYLNKNKLNVEDGFLFTNPFLINVMNEPTTAVGLYLNSIDTSLGMNYMYNNIECANQFLCSSFEVYRNALLGDDEYTFTVSLTPSSSLTFDVVDSNGVFTEKIIPKLIFTDDEKDICYLDMQFESYDKKDGKVYFSTKLKTDDCLTLSEKIRCYHLKDIDDCSDITHVIPYLSTICKLCVFTYDTSSAEVKNHKYNNIPDVSTFNLSNIFATREKELNLILPFSCIRSTMEYKESNNQVNEYSVDLHEIPLVSAFDMLDGNKFTDLMTRLSREYEYLNDIMSLLENGFSIDLKFMGTYGKSRMFKTENGDNLDRLNCKIQLDVCPFTGVDKDILSQTINEVIINFFDSINIDSNRYIKVSNLIKAIDELDEVDYLKFKAINDYDSNVQVLKNVQPSLSKALNSSTDMNFIPEYVNICSDDITINFIES